MRRFIAVVILCVGVASVVAAFERDMLNLQTPPGVEAGNAVVDVQHRFYGPVDDDSLGTVFGMAAGANVHLGLRYYPWRRLVVRPAVTFLRREYTVAAGYGLELADVADAEIGVQFFSYRVPEMEDRRQNSFYHLAVESKPLLNVLSPALAVGYDGYEERLGGGLGLAAGFDRQGLIKHVAVIGEYYPVFGRDDGRAGAEDCFAGGFELQTYGHHFTFLVGNSYEVGARRLMLGAPTNDLYFGFNIYRLVEF
jgi:hypothetical protein